jgi:ActR/RegA family two-component response regulator
VVDTARQRLIGHQILVVEDEYMLAMDLARSLQERGAVVIGPVGTVTEAMTLACREPTLAAAVLDINLGNERVFPVADVLDRRAIPFVFTTGYEGLVIPDRHQAVKRLEKPIDTEALVRYLSEIAV